MAKTTTIVVSLENRQKLLVIRESVLGLGASFNDVITELCASYKEHEHCAELLLRTKEKLRELENHYE